MAQPRECNDYVPVIACEGQTSLGTEEQKFARSEEQQNSIQEVVGENDKVKSGSYNGAAGAGLLAGTQRSIRFPICPRGKARFRSGTEKKADRR